MNEPIVTCRLYIAGQSANSRYAVQNLTAFCEKYLPNRHEIEIIDVFLEPERALGDRIFLTPALVVVSPSHGQSIVGDLSDNAVLLQALSVEIAAVGAEIASVGAAGTGG